MEVIMYVKIIVKTYLHEIQLLALLLAIASRGIFIIQGERGTRERCPPPPPPGFSNQKPPRNLKKERGKSKKEEKKKG